MAAATPNSFKDPYWSELASSVESKLELPKGLLSAIVSRGERSNNDQVSEAGAKTVFQIIPATRKAAIDKWGIDPYLSPENAAEVGGLLLKDSLDRNKGDVKLAVAEYVGGTNRSNWGPVTRAYVQRVTGGMPAAPVDLPPTPPAGPRGALPDGTQSTFDRLGGVPAAAPAVSQIANIYDAYQSGRMSPEQATAFEADVNAGKLMLPRGAALKTASTGAPAVNDPRANVVTAYNSGRMSPAQAEVFRRDVKAGTFVVPEGMSLMTPGTNDAIPLGPGESRPVTPAQPAPGFVDTVIGTGEAALQTVTGLAGGTVGMLGGGALGVAQDVAALARGETPTPGNVERMTQQGMQALTYAPRTPSGQAQGEAVGETLQALLPVMPLTAELGALARGAAPIVRATADATKAAPQVVKGAAATLADRVSSAMPGRDGAAKPTPGTMGSVGAAAVDMADQRRAVAAALPVPVELTKGQATRDLVQNTFERETAKGEAGGPLRERFADQNAAVPRNFEALIDETGARATSLRETGRAVVDEGLVKDAAKAKTEYKVKYKLAEKAGEMEDPVSAAPIVEFLRENESFNSGDLAPTLGLVQRELVRLGGADVVDGALVPRDLPLKQMELLRRQINSSINTNVTNKTNMKFGVDLKSLIDAETEGLGGTLYKEARKARQRYAQLYEDNAIVSDLLRARRGTADRQVALEDVFNRTILNGSRDDLSALRRTLQVSKSEEGAQAWRELQGATVRHLLDEATKGVSTDIRGNPIISSAKLNNAVRALDRDGKLEFVLSKRGAQQIRDINDLAQVVFTAPPGAVNSSNTAQVVIAALTESAASGLITGLPVPVLMGLRQLSKYSKDRALRTRIADALSQGKKRELSPAPKPMRPAPRPMQAPTSTRKDN